MFGMPSETPFDLRFRFLGIPVRVQAWFWVVSAVMGGAGRPEVTLADVVIWVGCVFVSVLVHEYGHGLTARALGFPASIVLYTMGGLCYTHPEGQRPWQRLLVLFAGPGAGFLLAGMAAGLAMGLALGGVTISRAGLEVLWTLITINVVWGLLNLLPIWPLDGGWITSVILGWFNPANGPRWAHVISLLSAGILAILTFRFLGDLFLTVLFAMFALVNFQVLQAMHARYQSSFRDEDWWRP